MRQQPFGQFVNYQVKQFWPFLVGAAVWSALITKIHMGIDDKARKESLYWGKVQRIQHPELFKDNHHGHGHH